MQVKPILEQLQNLFEYDVCIQLKRTICGGIATRLLSFSG
jgi:hypothetical protein